MSDRTYTSVNPLTIEQLVTESDWYLADEDDGLIEDGHGNEAWVLETEDGHVEMHVDDGEDVSDLLEAVPFHLLNDEEAEDAT
jgi:hypothetical protein